MIRSARLAGAVALGVSLALLGATSAVAGPPPKVRLKISRNADGPWVHDLSESNPPILPVGGTKNFYLRAKNTIGVTLQPELHVAFVTDGYRAKWFRNDRNITADVLADGKQFNLRAGRAKLFRLKVKHLPGGETAGCVVTEVELSDLREDFALVGFNVQTACD